MNSYNENLHSSVVSSLQAQELELQKVEAKLDASMLSLYYAQGARITTAEKLEVTTAKYVYEKKIHEQAVIDSDVSTNVLESANNVKTYTEKSVSNTSVAAANVQIAANAILKLTSDVGSIFSIVSAADYGTEIYTQAQQAASLMDNTAYAAELASQYSMDASKSIAEVTVKNLDDKATATDTSMKNLLKTVTSQFNATTELLSSQNAELASASVSEKKSEGKLEDISVAYSATTEAYNLSNDELNMNLHVITPLGSGDHTNYKVIFDVYQSPFASDAKNAQTQNSATNTIENAVQSYYIMLVKESKSSTFGVNTAEGILTQYPASDNTNPKHYIQVQPDEATKGKINKTIYIENPTGIANADVLYDTDGDQFVQGDDYVLFVLTVFTSAYKKSINTFDDYLSAPSMEFTLTKQLTSPSPLGMVMPTLDNPVFSFGVFEKPTYSAEYRCVLLPDNPELIRGLLTEEGLEYLNQQVDKKQQVELFYDTKITEINTKIAQLKGDDEAADSKTSGKSTSSKKTKSASNAKVSDTELIKMLQSRRKHLETQKEKAIAAKVHLKPGFFFNLTIAEQIPAGSYTVATKSEGTYAQYLLREADNVIEQIEEDKVKKLDADIAKLKKDVKNGNTTKFVIDALALVNDVVKEASGKTLEKLINDIGWVVEDLVNQANGYDFSEQQVTVKPETTDNFGNRLINGNAYIPAVISISDNEDEAQNQKFSNALSDYEHTDSFTYETLEATANYPVITELNNTKK